MSVWIFLSKTDMFLSLGAKDGPAVPLGHAHHHAGRTLDQVLGPVFPGQHHGAAQLGADAGHSGIWTELLVFAVLAGVEDGAAVAAVKVAAAVIAVFAVAEDEAEAALAVLVEEALLDQVALRHFVHDSGLN